MSDFADIIVSLGALAIGLMHSVGHATTDTALVWLAVYAVMMLVSINMNVSRGDE